MGLRSLGKGYSTATGTKRNWPSYRAISFRSGRKPVWGREGATPLGPRLRRVCGDEALASFLAFLNSCFLYRAKDRYPQGRAPLWREDERSVRKNGAYWQSFCPPGLPVPMTNRLKSRKGNGTRACRDITRSWAPQRGGWVLGKVCMVKAGLPELQSPAANR
jgi:hypothetical protein